MGWKPYANLPQVMDSPDFRRIKALPVRSRTDLDALATELTSYLRTTHGTMSLKPIQAFALADMYEADGLLGGLGVGSGKTLISLLASVLLQAERPLLLIPAALKAKTTQETRQYAHHFRVARNLQVLTYSALSRVSCETYLDDYQPDLIIADECHALKDRNAARTRRFLRYFRSHDCKFVGLSGTITRRSLRDFWHLLNLALPNGSPLPYSWGQLEGWSLAVDAKIDESRRVRPGVLIELLDEHERDESKEPQDLARLGVRRRISKTLGCVLTEDVAVNSSLQITFTKLDVPRDVDQSLRDLRNTWETPNGDYLEWAIAVWQHARQLCCGFYYRWQPPAPKKWLAARREWQRFVRDQLATRTAGLDSPLQVAQHFSDSDEYQAWAEIRSTFKPNPIPNWIDDFALIYATEWLKREKGIVWVEHEAVGMRLAALSNTVYFGGGKKASEKIINHNGPMICSIAAHGTGKNLQAHHKCLVLSPPVNGKDWEQLLGRTHRQGQEADCVEWEVLVNSEEIAAGLENAFSDAKYIQEISGQQQRLLMADKIDRSGFDLSFQGLA